MREFAKQARIELHAAPAGIHHASGSAEALVKRVLLSLRALVHGLNLRDVEWPKVVRLLEASINHTRTRKYKVPPVTAMSDAKAYKPFGGLDAPGSSSGRAPSATTPRVLSSAEVAEATRDLRDGLGEQAGAFDFIPNKSGRRGPIGALAFVPGDFVLVAAKRDSSNKRERAKLALTWRGPFVVVARHSAWLYLVRSLVDATETRVYHLERLRFYSDDRLIRSDALMDVIQRVGDGYVLRKIVGHRQVSRFELECKWDGFDLTSWEPLANIFEDAPTRVRQYWAKLSPAIRTAMQREVELV